MTRRISVTVKRNAKHADITPLSDTEFRVAVTAPSQDGKANKPLSSCSLVTSKFLSRQSRFYAAIPHDKNWSS